VISEADGPVTIFLWTRVVMRYHDRAGRVALACPARGAAVAAAPLAGSRSAPTLARRVVPEPTSTCTWTPSCHHGFEAGEPWDTLNYPGERRRSRSRVPLDACGSVLSNRVGTWRPAM
jgi:hypothetical protein